MSGDLRFGDLQFRQIPAQGGDDDFERIGMELNEKQKERYARNIAVDEIGREGQQKLLGAKVLVIGAGGLGSPVALYLAAAGVGHIGIVDEDKIEVSNLQRQILYDTYYLGRPKVEIAAEKLNELNDDVKITTYDLRLTAENAENIIKEYDIIADCTDDFPTRFLINDICMKLDKTLVSAAVVGFEGQVYTFKKEICNYRDIYDEPPEGLIPPCSQAGVVGSACGTIGSLQATEIIKEILKIGESLAGKMLVFDLLMCRMRMVNVN